MLSKIYIVACKRTPFGAFNGTLKKITATELGAIASKAAIDMLPENAKIDSVIYGNVLQTSTDAPYLSRHVGLRCNIAKEVPALTLNRLCGSGFQSVISAVHEIRCGDSSLILAGGTESMSQAPHVIRGARLPTPYGKDIRGEDSLMTALVDNYPESTPMGITAENLGEKYKIDRSMCDQYAIKSQRRWYEAQESGNFKSEIVPIDVKDKKKVVHFDTDEHPRPNTTLEGLSKLSPVFKPNTGLVTAGNASGISDGAASLIIASEKAVQKYSLTPLAEVISYHVAGVDPSIMGIGPVPAIKGALSKKNLELKDMDLIEVNEAFSAQYLAVEKELGLDRSKTNTNGGGIALGHPLAASGARILVHLTYELIRTKKEYAIGSACIGGGQGIAVVIKNCK